jgi:hypothetical protein
MRKSKIKEVGFHCVVIRPIAFSAVKSRLAMTSLLGYLALVAATNMLAGESYIDIDRVGRCLKQGWFDIVTSLSLYHLLGM